MDHSTLEDKNILNSTTMSMYTPIKNPTTLVQFSSSTIMPDSLPGLELDNNEHTNNNKEDT